MRGLLWGDDVDCIDDASNELIFSFSLSLFSLPTSQSLPLQNSQDSDVLSILPQTCLLVGLLTSDC